MIRIGQIYSRDGHLSTVLFVYRDTIVMTDGFHTTDNVEHNYTLTGIDVTLIPDGSTVDYTLFGGGATRQGKKIGYEASLDKIAVRDRENGQITWVKSDLVKGYSNE
jgi:hypothetical protein